MSLPLLYSAGIKEATINFETDGLDWRGGAKPIGVAWALPDGTAGYDAWRHASGNNTDEATVRRWFDREVRELYVTNANMKFDCHVGRNVGMDFEENKCRVSDVQIWAGLLDDKRKKFNLDVLITDKLGEVPMVRLDESRMRHHDANVARPRAEYGVRAVRRLKDVMMAEMDRLGLQKVRDLEDRVIHPVVLMEQNGAPIDVEKLKKWDIETQEALWDSRREVAKMVGVAGQQALFDGGLPPDYTNPDSAKDMVSLFKTLGLPITLTKPDERKGTKGGQPSFTAAILRRIDHPVTNAILRQGKLLDLRAKYIVPYLAAVRNGLLPYELHQTRDDEHGTRRGRFSASRQNIQQVMKPKKQAKTYGWGDRWCIRELFIAPADCLLVSADAAQIEYRIFSCYAGNEDVLEAYRQDPKTDYHDKSLAMIRKFKPDVDRDKTKTLNFLTIYGGGATKLALELGNITFGQYYDLIEEYGKSGPPETHPLLASTMAIRRAYDAAIPEAKTLKKKMSKVAENRGYVIDIYGRRATFDANEAYKALNAVIQPSAAEVNKEKVCELHAVRKQWGLVPMMSVHDEWVGGVPTLEAAKAVDEVLNRQSFPQFEVPIIWDVRWGMNWANCGTNANEFHNGCTGKSMTGVWS